MKDVITLGLAKRGFNVHKYVPYGPIKEVIPYLVRRAQENSGFIGDNVELQLLTEVPMVMVMVI
jgi:proline dehydrogenase